MSVTWQPFDTAPKDGSIFLGFDSDDGGGVYMAVVCVHWDEGDEEEGYEPGWIVQELGSGDYIDNCNLTHWTPIPSGPNIN